MVPCLVWAIPGSARISDQPSRLVARGSASDESEGKPRSLPREIRLRLTDTRSHYRALAFALEQVSVEDYELALRDRTAEALTKYVYPIERPFEILSNYVIELTRMGLELANRDSTGAGPAMLERLRVEGVISEQRRAKLKYIHDQRNELQHEYPDARGALVYDAAKVQVAELPGFFRDYAAWMRRLGFGRR